MPSTWTLPVAAVYTSIHSDNDRLRSRLTWMITVRIIGRTTRDRYIVSLVESVDIIAFTEKCWYRSAILVFTARCTLVQSAVLRSYVVRPSVCLGVKFRYRDHIGWNSWKIIARPNSLRPLLGLSPTWAIWCNGNTPKLGRNRSGVTRERKKLAISPKRCKIGPRQDLLRTNIKSYTRFRLVPKSRPWMTLNQGLPKVFFKYPLLSQEGVKLWPSTLAGTFIRSIRTNAH